MNLVQKLRQMVGEVQTARGGALDDAWSLVGRLLGRMPVDQAEVERVCAGRDLAGLDALVSALESPAPAPGGPVGEEVQRQMAPALKAFRKRLKLARLNDESKLGGRRLSGGKRSQIDAIIPPTDYPRAVWDALVASGDLKDAGGGFFALVE